ncbi:MAG: EamA family transporter [Sediminibacterium sp.]|nr:EamA family transporter [Sediminibacterium sp.]
MSSFKRSLLQLHVFVFLAGLTAPIGNLIQLNGLVLVFYRMLLTVLVLFPIYLMYQNKAQVPLKEKARLMLIGVLIAIHWVCFYGSIKLANVSIALVCISSVGIFTAFLEPIFLKTKFIWNDIYIGFLSLIGIFFIFQFDIHFRTGILVGLVSALFASIFTIINKRLTTEHSTQTIQTFEMMGGLGFLTMVILAMNAYQQSSFILPTSQDWFWLIILALVCTVLANHLMLNALKKISAFTMNVTLNLEPVYGIMIAILLFQEQKQMGKGFYIGIVLIAVSVLLQMIRVLRQQNHK